MTYDELIEARDWAERKAHELNEEQRLYDEDSQEWLSFLEEINDAENEVDYLQSRLDTGDYDD